MLSYLLTAYNRFNLNYSIRETEPRDSVLFFAFNEFGTTVDSVFAARTLIQQVNMKKIKSLLIKHKRHEDEISMDPD